MAMSAASVWLICAMGFAAAEIAFAGSFILLSVALGAFTTSLAVHFFHLSMPAQFTVAAAASAAFAYPLVFIVRKRIFGFGEPKFKSGAERLVGRVGVVTSIRGGVLRVRISGSVWMAEVRGEQVRLQPGDHVRVVGISGVTLLVRKITE